MSETGSSWKIKANFRQRVAHRIAWNANCAVNNVAAWKSYFGQTNSKVPRARADGTTLETVPHSLLARPLDNDRIESIRAAGIRFESLEDQRLSRKLELQTWHSGPRGNTLRDQATRTEGAKAAEL